MRAWSSCLQGVECEAASSAPEHPSSGGQIAGSERPDEQYVERTRVPAEVREKIAAILVQIILGQSQEVLR